MRATIPIEVTDSMIVSSTISEPFSTEPGYSSTTAYSIDSKVTVGHDVYVSLENSNIGNDPLTSVKWKKIYKSNKFRMFDFNDGTPSSVSASSMTVVIKPGQRIDSIILGGLKADRAEIIVKKADKNEVVYELDVILRRRNATTWWEYLFSQFDQQRVLATYQIPPVINPLIQITLYSNSSNIEIERFGFGLSFYLGTVLNVSPIVDSENFSVIERDDFGRATLTSRPSIPTAKVKIATRANRLNAVLSFKKNSSAKVVAWSGLDDIVHNYSEPLAFFGVHQEFTTDLSDEGFAQIDLFLEGV